MEKIHHKEFSPNSKDFIEEEYVPKEFLWKTNTSGEKNISIERNNWCVQITKNKVRYREYFPKTNKGFQDAIKHRDEILNNL